MAALKDFKNTIKTVQGLAGGTEGAKKILSLIFTGKESRVGTANGDLMMLVAFLTDLSFIAIVWLLDWALGAGEIIVAILGTCFAAPLFYIWVSACGVNYMSPKKALSLLVPILGSIIPGNELTIILAFQWTLGIGLTLFFTRIEDQTEAEERKKQTRVRAAQEQTFAQEEEAFAQRQSEEQETEIITLARYKQATEQGALVKNYAETEITANALESGEIITPRRTILRYN